MVEQPQIIVFIRNLPTKSGGVQKGVFHLYEYLREQGYDIEFILNSETQSIQKFKGFHVTACPFPTIYKYPFTKRSRLYNARLKYVKRIIKDRLIGNQVTLIAHWAPDFVMLSEFNSYPQIKTIFSFHGPYHTKHFTDYLKLNLPWLQSKIKRVKHIDAFAFISNHLKDQFVKDNHLPPQKSHTIRNGVVIPKIDYSKTDNRQPNSFLVLSRLNKNKNIMMLLKACHVLKEKNKTFQMDIYGDGPDYDAYQEFITNHNLQDVITLKGYHNNIKDILPQYDIYLSASLFEGLPLGVLEAMSYGVIPLLSRIGPHEEVLSDYKQDLLFSLDDMHELVNKLENVMKKSDSEKDILRASLIKNVQKEFDIQVRYQRFNYLINSLQS